MDLIIKLILKLAPIAGSAAVFSFIQAVMSTKKDQSSALAMGALTAQSGQGSGATGMKLNANGTLLEKLDYFLAKNLALEQPLDQLHMMLGRPAHPQPIDMLHQKEIFVVVAGFFLFFIVGPLGLVLAPLAFFVPDALASGKIQNRQQEILGNFAAFVDLTALIIEAGSDYMVAFERISKVVRKKTDLEIEIEKTINEVSLGSSRKDALRHLAERTGVQEIRSFVGLITQSEELGTSLVELLREFSKDMRFRRLNKAEKLAAQAATKMLIPLFVFIFPTVFIMMLAPMVKDLVSGGGMPF